MAIIRRKGKGLGDLVETAVAPVVTIIKVVTGIDLSNCGGCKKRKDLLNKL